MHVQGNNPSGAIFPYLQGRMHLVGSPVYHSPPSSPYLFSRRLSSKFPGHKRYNHVIQSSCPFFESSLPLRTEETSSVNPPLWTPPACHLCEFIAGLCWASVDRLDIRLWLSIHLIPSCYFQHYLQTASSFKSLISTLLCQAWNMQTLSIQDFRPSRSGFSYLSA
jgi:hypothetical protein